MKGLILYTDGRMEYKELPKAEHTYQRLQQAIGCGLVDIVHAVNLPQPYCLVVDDEGLLTDEPKINLAASFLYGIEEHGQPICGDCLIMKDHHTDDGIETVGLTQEEAEKVVKLFFENKEAILRIWKRLARKGD